MPVLQVLLPSFCGRLSAADQILVLDKGRIVEQGSHDALKSAGGIYQKIYETQTGAQEVIDG